MILCLLCLVSQYFTSFASFFLLKNNLFKNPFDSIEIEEKKRKLHYLCAHNMLISPYMRLLGEISKGTKKDFNSKDQKYHGFIHKVNWHWKIQIILFLWLIINSESYRIVCKIISLFHRTQNGRALWNVRMPIRIFILSYILSYNIILFCV